MNIRSLGSLAETAERAVLQHKSRRESADIVRALQTRLDSLVTPARQLAELRKTSDLLRKRGMPKYERTTINRLQKLDVKLSKLRETFAADKESIVQPNALPLAELEDVCARLKAEVGDFWRKHVTAALPNDNVLSTFEQHLSWKPVITKIRTLKHSLSLSATRLPQNATEIDNIDSQVEAAQLEFQKLPNLSEKKKQFLKRSIEPGVSLAELLSDAELLAWIKDQGLDRDLRVVSR